MAEGNVETPYYLKDPNEFTHLESKISILPSELRPNYRNLESAVSGAFNNAYGQYLNENQRRYMGGIQTLFTAHETAQRFSEERDKGVVSIDVKDGSIKGNIYTNYSIGHSNDAPRHETKTQEGSIVRQYWAGRIVVYPLDNDEIIPVNTKWLMTQEAFDEAVGALDAKDAWDAIDPFVYTNSIGSTIVHEKVHGVQDYRLPLPVLEAAAHYYQRELFKKNGWYCEIGSNMNLFADYYGQCIKDLGEDVHRLIFGNIEDEAKRSDLLQKLKDRFSPEKIEEISKHNEYDFMESSHKWVQWRTETEEHVAAEIEALKGQKTEKQEKPSSH